MGKKKATSKPCHCGNAKAFNQCCGRFIAGSNTAQTAEQLMRSRYSAFVEHAKDYLQASWHPAHVPEDLDIDSQQKWLGLKILHTEAGQAQDSTGVVEFVARYTLQGKAYRLHEVSQFERHQGHWVYTTGMVGRPSGRQTG